MEASRSYSTRKAAAKTPSQPIYANVLPLTVEAKSTPAICSCTSCPANELNLCERAWRKPGPAGERADMLPLPSTVHTIPARRIICHPKEWSEFVPVICDGWAASSIALPDGRQQILSFLLPGDFISMASVLEPTCGCSVEAITEVTCRKFKRADIKARLLMYSNLMEKLTRIWIEERAQADQLALDLGRRTADQRIARLILTLADKLTKRGMMHGQKAEFPLRQRHIADATGLTSVHISKVLGEFQRAGLIEIDQRSLTIIDQAELRRVVEWR
jgi:CRP/FNR family transcriptional regulator